MQFRHARELFDYWLNCPPENEILAMLARTYTTWEPQIAKTEEEAREQHRKSLEARWKAGAMNAAQLLAAAGGAGALAVTTSGAMVPAAGISGPFGPH